MTTNTIESSQGKPLVISPRPKSQRSSEETPFSIIQIISRSKFHVFLAEDNESHTKCAVKVFPNSGKDNNTCENFYTEAALSHIQHPHITQITKLISNQKIILDKQLTEASIILMEHAPFGDLADLIMKKSFTSDEIMARTIFHQIHEGLSHLHKHGFAHMDLKCDNILIGEDYKVKLCDFDSIIEMTNPPTEVGMRGTLHFRAPEIVQGSNGVKIDFAKADVYALGVLIFCVLLKRFPFREDLNYSKIKMLDDLWGTPESYWEKYPADKEIKDGLSSEFKDLFRRMTCPDPSQRYDLDDIANSEWFKGPIYGDEEYQKIMKKYSDE